MEAGGKEVRKTVFVIISTIIFIFIELEHGNKSWDKLLCTYLIILIKDTIFLGTFDNYPYVVLWIIDVR